MKHHRGSVRQSHTKRHTQRNVAPSSSMLPYFHSLFHLSHWCYLIFIPSFFLTLSQPFPRLQVSNLVISGLSFLHFFCTNEELHVYFLIPPFFLRWRIAYYICFWGLFIFHITICRGNHFVSLHRLFLHLHSIPLCDCTII